MRTVLSLLVVTIAASVLMSSCAQPEPTPRNVHVGMTKQQVLKEFGSPDYVTRRRERAPMRASPIVDQDGKVIHGRVIWEGSVSPETFRYYNQDGSLVTQVRFSEEGRVINVVRGPVPKN